MWRRGPKPPRGGLVARCAWCHRVRTDHGWVVPAAEPDPATVTHTICPDCQAELRLAGRSV